LGLTVTNEKTRHPSSLAFPYPSPSHNVATGLHFGVFQFARDIHVGDSCLVIIHRRLRCYDGLLRHLVLVGYPRGAHGLKYSRGFTLVELAIVMAIMAILAVMVVKSGVLVGTAKTADAIAIANDISNASMAFKAKYHYLPGDFPVNTTTPEISDLSLARNADCLAAPRLGNGDGLISAKESQCVPVQLFASGMTKVHGTVQTDPADIKSNLYVFQTRYGLVQVIQLSASKTYTSGTAPLPAPNNVFNVIELLNLPCDVAQEMDSKMDDGSLATGKIRASVPACTDTQPVSLAVPL
jgi:prepilin-type N-terminal cleavage/methylation domain-containing protein